MELLKLIKGITETIVGLLYELITLDFSAANHEVVYTIIGLIIAFFLLKQLVISIVTFPALAVRSFFGRLADWLAKWIGRFLKGLSIISARLVYRSSQRAYKNILVPGGQKGANALKQIWYRWRMRGSSYQRENTLSSSSFSRFLQAHQYWKLAWKERLLMLRTQIWYSRHFK